MQEKIPDGSSSAAVWKNNPEEHKAANVSR